VVSAWQTALESAVTGSSSQSRPALAVTVPLCRVTAAALREGTWPLSIDSDLNGFISGIHLELINLSVALAEEAELGRLGIPLPPCSCMAPKNVAARSAHPALWALPAPAGCQQHPRFPGSLLALPQPAMLPALAGAQPAASALLRPPSCSTSSLRSLCQGLHHPKPRRAGGPWIHLSTGRVPPLASCPLS